MPILKAQKVALVEKLLNELEGSRVSLVVSYVRLNMKANDDIRTKAFEQNGKIRMLSNNLLRLILKKQKRELDIPEKPLALAYGFEDEVTAAKTLVQFGKETDSLEVIGGWIDGTFFDAAQVKTLASLPSKETLQAQLVGRLSGIIGSLAYGLNYPIQKFAYVVDAVKAAQPEAGVKTEPVSTEPEQASEQVTEEEAATNENPETSTAEESTEVEEGAEEVVKEENNSEDKGE